MRSLRHFHVQALLLGLATACGTPVEPAPPAPPPPGPAVTGAAPFYVSTSILVNGVGRAFVSLPPGHLVEAKTVSLLVLRTRARAAGVPVDGGLDAISIPALVGDTIALEVDGQASVPLRRWFVVPAVSAPRIVRVTPAQGDVEVALNAPIQVAFSEPIDPTSVPPTGALLRAGGIPVDGAVWSTDSAGIVLEFHPASHLTPGLPHQLTLSAEIRSLGGTGLDSSVVVSFETAPLVVAPAGKLAFVRRDQIFVLTAAGELIQLTRTARTIGRDRIRNSEPAWSPNGLELAFVSNRFNNAEVIYRMGADGSSLVELVRGRAPSWSPDGRAIAFEEGFAVSTFGLSGGITVLYATAAWSGQPAWAPDGSTILFSTNYRDFYNNYDLYGVDPDGAMFRPFLISTGLLQSQFFFQPAWSPDGGQIAFAVCAETFNWCEPGSLAVMNVDGTGFRLLTGVSGLPKPAWSPDGNTIAFATAGRIHLIDVDGGNERLLLTNAGSPSWHP